MNSTITATDMDYFKAKVESLSVKNDILQVSEWAEKTRYFPHGTSPIVGYWRNSTTPYLQEIMDCFSVDSPVKEVVFMKGSQIGATSALENIIGYIIDCNPAPTMFMSTTQEMAQNAMELRIDRMINSAPSLGNKIKPSDTKNFVNRGNHKTGSTKSKKEFTGGFLLAAGSHAPSKLRSVSIKYLLCDEIDGYPDSAGEEGSPIGLAVKRTNAYSASSKILYISTPLFKHNSNIDKLYESGDQRLYHVPCKDCGAYQPLRFSSTDGSYGLIFKFDKRTGKLIEDSVRYKCINCESLWVNDDKTVFLSKGRWQPTIETTKSSLRSYHLNALYSPVGMLSWSDIANEWSNSHKKRDSLKVFKNTVLGEAFEEQIDFKSYKYYKKFQLNYQIGEIPPDVLFLTLGADIAKNRIDVEVLGWADNCKNYSINFLSFEGTTDYPNQGAWQLFQSYLENTFSNPKMPPIVAGLVDSGYNTDQVYQFCKKNVDWRLYPIKGVGGHIAIDFFKVVSKDDTRLVEAKVDAYKDRLQGWLNLPHPPPEDSKDSYCFYPKNYPDSFFQQMVSERKVEERDKEGGLKGYKWQKVYPAAKNHAWDCRIYNMVAFDLFFQECCEYAKTLYTLEEFFEVTKQELGRK